MLMKARGKVDWTKCFRLVEDLKQFDCLPSHLDPEEDNSSQPNSEQTDLSDCEEAVRARRDIVVPAMAAVPRLCPPKPHAAIPPNYIRVAPHQQLPLADYELTHCDLSFIEMHFANYFHNNVYVLNEGFLRGAIEWLEHVADRSGGRVRMEEKGLLVDYVDEEYNQMLCMPNLDQLLDAVFHYWLERRRLFRAPLLREFWKKNQEMGMLAVFKPREKETRILRRSSRLTESRALVDMECELLMGLQLTESIALREGKKLTLSFLSLTSLHYETEDMAGMDMDGPALKDIWRDKLGSAKRETARRRIAKTAELIRSNLKSLQKNEEVKQSNDEAANRQNSILHFLATVIA